MKAVIQELRECGYRVELDEGRIGWTWDRDGTPDPDRVMPLLECLKRNKADAIRVILEEDLSCPFVEPPATGKPVHLHSRILDANLWIVPDGWTGKLDGPVYSDTEVRELNQLQPTPEELRAIHRTKSEFDGEVVALGETGP